MSVNPHDDYEKLAKLLYPSIEASGNVYYGQTRKLTLDEVLKRNSLGFDSHIESFYNEDYNAYDSYFCWRLGSLHGSIAIDQFVDSVSINNFPDIDFIKRILYADSEEVIYDNNLIYAHMWEDSNTLYTSKIPIFGTIFAKYRLDKHSITITNKLNSGSYDSYEFDVEPVLDGLYVTDDFNPVNSIDDDISERHFYISREDGVDYLYIQILTSKDTDKFLTFTALKDSEISLSMGQPSDGFRFRIVEYRVSDYNGNFPDTWENYHYDWEVAAAPTGSISLTRGCKVQFKSNIENAVLFNNTEYCLKFVVNSGKVFVSGSCMSMCHPDIDESTITSLENYALYGLFSGIENMYGTPILPNIRKLGIGCYNSMFSNCTSLTVAPKLKSSVTYDTDHIDNSYCYSNMFSGCISLVSPPKMMGYDNTDQDYHSGAGTCRNMFINCKNLKSSPVIHYKTLDSYGCYQMFSGCSSLKIIQCGAKYIFNSATTLWVNDVPSKGTFIKSSANYYSNVNGIPAGWVVITKDDEYFAVHKDPEIGFRIDKHIPNEHYKNDYLVTSGTDSAMNGRGYIANDGGTENTIGKMERSFDENKIHKMNTYNPDGSFNQEIWGYKTFNSPVQFRNGLYGEDWSVYTFDYSTNPQVNQKSVVISKDTDTSASIQIYKQSSYMGGVADSIILSSAKPSLTYDSNEVIATIEVKSNGDQYGHVDSSSIQLNANTIKLATDDTCIDLDKYGNITASNNLNVASSIIATNLYLKDSNDEYYDSDDTFKMYCTSENDDSTVDLILSFIPNSEAIDLRISAFEGSHSFIAPYGNWTWDLGTSEDPFSKVFTEEISANPIINTLSGLGMQGNESYNTFGDIGTIGLFSYNKTTAIPGEDVPGSDLIPAAIEYYYYTPLIGDPSYKTVIGAGQSYSMDGRWRLLSGCFRRSNYMGTISEYRQIVLAIRIS